MSDWLSEIEERDREFWEGYSEAARKGAAVCAEHCYYDRRRMVRVIRELVRGIGIYDETCTGMTAKPGNFSKIAAWWGNISSDAEELLRDV